MQVANFQPHAAKASLDGQRPLEWPSAHTLRQHVWSKRMSGVELEKAEAKYLRDKNTLQGTYRDFEAHFVTQLLNAMNKTVEKNKMFHGGDVEDMFTERMNDELAKRLVEGGKGFGISEMLEQQHLRKTYYRSETMAKLIRRENDAAAQEGVKGELSKIESASASLMASAMEPVESDLGPSYQDRKAALLAEEGLNDESPGSAQDAQAWRSQGDKSIQERMAELQAASAYQFKNNKGIGIH